MCRAMHMSRRDPNLSPLPHLEDLYEPLSKGSKIQDQGIWKGLFSFYLNTKLTQQRLRWPDVAVKTDFTGLL